MTLLQALAYFAREAAVNLLRGWKISLLAVATIATSLFIGGAFLLVVVNAERLVSEWRQEAKVVVYLERGLAPEEAVGVRETLSAVPWVTEVDAVTAAEARRRFQESFPSVADLVEGWGEEPLPATFEVGFDPGRAEPAAFEAWIAELRQHPQTQMVDDDRDWVRRLELALQVALGLGLTLGLVLLGAAIFTIASVIRLTALLYRDEIAVMRLVGATEFYIRGPFYFEGLLQGLCGGLLAVLGLYLGFVLLRPDGPASLIAGVMSSAFLSPLAQVVLVAVGVAAGLVGAVTSLRREAI